MNVRLLDFEGVTVANFAIPDKTPPPVLYSAVFKPPRYYDMLNSPELPDILGELNIKKLEYELERVDGGGTYIYRRVTPLW